MPEKTPEQRALQELGFVLGTYPEIRLGDLARALQEGSLPAATSEGGGLSWDDLVAPVLDCARAFGWSGNFSGPEQAATILQREFSVRLGKSSPWRTLSGVAALHLLEAGPEKALELMRRYDLKVPPRPRSASKAKDSSPPSDRTKQLFQLVHGIVNSEEL